MEKICFKRFLGLAVMALGLALPASAQTATTARVNGSDYTTVADGSTRFYLYNVGTGRFMINSGHWGEYAYTIHQDYGSTFTMTSGYLIDTQMIASSVSSTAHYLGLNVPGVTSAGTYGDTNAFGPIYEANSSYGNDGTISGTRQWNFTRVETDEDATTYTYYMYETLNGTNYYMGVGYGIDGDESDNNTNLNTWAALLDVNEGTMTTEDVTDKTEFKDTYDTPYCNYYQWRLVTESELRNILVSTMETSFGGLNADCSYLIHSGEFDRNTSVLMNTYWKTNGGTLSLVTPSSDKELGMYSYGSFVGNGSFYQEIDMTGMPTGYYTVDFDALALNGSATATATNANDATVYADVTIDKSTGYDNSTTEGQLVIAQDLDDEEMDTNHTLTFSYTKGSGNVVLSFSALDGITIVIDNIRIHFLGDEPAIFDDSSANTDEVLTTKFDTRTVLLRREFKTDGQWNSLVLPFDMTTAQVKECFGSQVKLAKLTGLDDASETSRTIHFTSVALPSEGTAIKADSMYIIKLDKKPSYYVFTGGATNAYKIGRRAYDGTQRNLTPTYTTADGKLIAKGTYISMGKGCPDGSYVFSNGDLYHLTEAKDIKGYRFWFTENIGSNAKFDVSEFDPETTEIDGIIVKSQKANQGVYTINGQKVSNDNAGNLPKGLYIVNGKKVVIK